jgi:hypothetical protein
VTTYSALWDVVKLGRGGSGQGKDGGDSRDLHGERSGSSEG